MTTMFGANESQLQELRSSGEIDPVDRGLITMELGGISPIALATLDSAITGDAADQVLDTVLGSPLEVVDEGEQLLFATRPELGDALRSGDRELATRAGITWAKTEEMQLDQWSIEDCQRAIEALFDMATRLPQESSIYAFLSV